MAVVAVAVAVSKCVDEMKGPSVSKLSMLPWCKRSNVSNSPNVSKVHRVRVIERRYDVIVYERTMVRTNKRFNLRQSSRCIIVFMFVRVHMRDIVSRCHGKYIVKCQI